MIRCNADRDRNGKSLARLAPVNSSKGLTERLIAVKASALRLYDATYVRMLCCRDGNGGQAHGSRHSFDTFQIPAGLLSGALPLSDPAVSSVLLTEQEGPESLPVPEMYIPRCPAGLGCSPAELSECGASACAIQPKGATKEVLT